MHSGTLVHQISAVVPAEIVLNCCLFVSLRAFAVKGGGVLIAKFVMYSLSSLGFASYFANKSVIML